MAARSHVRRLRYGGRALTLQEWHQETGVPLPTLYWRESMGWTTGQILGFEPNPRQNAPTVVTYQGRSHTFAEWSQILDVPAATLKARHARGRTPGQILGFEKLIRTRRKDPLYRRSDGVSATLAEWGRLLGRSEKTIQSRLARGWEIDRALELPSAMRRPRGRIHRLNPVP